jgi:hypothetical protein
MSYNRLTCDVLISSTMNIADAQREVRTTYLGGFVGQLVSAAIWLASAACATWISPRLGIIVLILGGIFIFPITQLLIALSGRPASLPPTNPFRELAIEIAFLVPLLLPLVGAATLHRPEWFYPAMMVVVGAHYLPFAFLYGMRQFVALSALLFSAGLLLGLYAIQLSLWGAWLTGVLLIAFAVAGLSATRNSRGAR